MKARDAQATALAEAESPQWSSLCRVGGIATVILIVYSLATIVQVVLLGGQPASAAEAFSLLEHHRIIALLRLDLPTILVMPLYYLLFLGLFASLYRTNPAHVILATLLVFMGVTLALATPAALSMIPLSDKYAAATKEAARSQLVAAGEAILASDIWHATGAFVGGILTQCGAVLICIVMLRGKVFGKITAYLGIVMYGLDLVHILCAPFWPSAGFVLMAVAGPLYPVWFFLVGRRLLVLGRTGSISGPATEASEQ